MADVPVYFYIGNANVIGGHLNSYLAVELKPELNATSTNGLILKQDAVSIAGTVVVGVSITPVTDVSFTATSVVSVADLNALPVAGEWFHFRNETRTGAPGNQGFFQVKASPPPTLKGFDVEGGGMAVLAGGDDITIAKCVLALMDATQSNGAYLSGDTNFASSFGSDLPLMLEKLQVDHPAGGVPFFLLKFHAADGINLIDPGEWQKAGIAWNELVGALVAFEGLLSVLAGGPYTTDVRGFFISIGNSDIGTDDHVGLQTAFSQWFFDLRDTFVSGVTFGAAKQTCPIIVNTVHESSWTSKVGAAKLVNVAMREIVAQDPNARVLDISDLGILGNTAVNAAILQANQELERGRRFHKKLTEILNPLTTTNTPGVVLAEWLGQSQVPGALSVLTLTTQGDARYLGTQPAGKTPPDPVMWIWDDVATQFVHYQPEVNSSTNGGGDGTGYSADIEFFHQIYEMFGSDKDIYLVKHGWANSFLGTPHDILGLADAVAVSVDAPSKTFTLTSGVWDNVAPVAGRFIEVAGFGSVNDGWHEVDAGSTTTTLVVKTQFSSLVTVGSTAAITIDTSRGVWNKADGHLYDWSLTELNKAKDWLKDNGLAPDMLASIFTQGENDEEDDALSTGYEAELLQFITDRRSDVPTRVGEPDMAFLVTKLNDYVPTANITIIRAAEEKVAAEDDQVFLVDMDNVESKADLVHWSHQGAIQAGKNIGNSLKRALRDIYTVT